MHKNREGKGHHFCTNFCTYRNTKMFNRYKDLNGEYSDFFNEKTSICIASNLIRNEKILSALSTGALIRSTKYLFDSAEKGELLEPFNYEDQLDNLVSNKERYKMYKDEGRDSRITFDPYHLPVLFRR